MKMMPKDKLKQMVEQQKKASGLTATGDAVTPTDGSKPTTATTTSGNAGASYSQRKVRKFQLFYLFSF